MEIRKVPIKDVYSWDKNPRGIDNNSFNRLKKQISKLGFYKPLICYIEDGKYITLGGNMRLKALKELGFEEVEVSIIYPKTEAEKVEYSLSDNDTVGYYEGDKLLKLFEEVGEQIDFSDYNVDTGVSIPIKDVYETLETVEPIPDVSLSEILTSNSELNLKDSLNFGKMKVDSDNVWGIPIIKKQNIALYEIEAFNRIKASIPKPYSFIHFFLDDSAFSVVWNQPDRYIDMFKKWGGCFSPDFSLFMDYPLSIQIWNVYRNRWCGAYWQSNGINVIPTISWSDANSFNFCFCGVEKGSYVACSTVGIMRNEAYKEAFKVGFDKMLSVIEPEFVFMYGSGWKWIDERCNNKVKWFEPFGFWSVGRN